MVWATNHGTITCRILRGFTFILSITIFYTFILLITIFYVGIIVENSIGKWFLHEITTNVFLSIFDGFHSASYYTCEVIHPNGRFIMVPFKKCLFQFPLYMRHHETFLYFLKAIFHLFAGIKNIFMYNVYMYIKKLA